MSRDYIAESGNLLLFCDKKKKKQHRSAQRLIKINIGESVQHVGEPVPWRNSLFNAPWLNLEFNRVHPLSCSLSLKRKKEKEMHAGVSAFRYTGNTLWSYVSNEPDDDGLRRPTSWIQSVDQRLSPNNLYRDIFIRSYFDR